MNRVRFPPILIPAASFAGWAVFPILISSMGSAVAGEISEKVLKQSSRRHKKRPQPHVARLSVERQSKQQMGIIIKVK